VQIGKCLSCGVKGYFLALYSCVVCGKNGCEKCLTYVLTLELSDSQNNKESERVWVCSEECNNEFKEDFGTVEKEIIIDLKKLLKITRCASQNK
jgi:hypothetical protein